MKIDRPRGLKTFDKLQNLVLRRTPKRHWAQERKYWATDDWERFHFTDESTFEIGRPNRSPRVRRYPGEQYNDNCLVPSFKSGRISTIFWGVIYWHGKGQLICLRGEGHMTGVKYKEKILQDALPLYIREFENSSGGQIPVAVAPCRVCR
jgi:hypothetical protein